MAVAAAAAAVAVAAAAADLLCVFEAIGNEMMLAFDTPSAVVCALAVALGVGTR